MEIEQIKELMGYLEESKLSKLIFKKGDMEIRLEKEPERPKYQVTRSMPAEAVSEGAFQSDAALHGERGGSIRREESPILTGTFVTSPMVGTFYSSAAPDQPPFVKVGDKVNEETIVCIIEAMKVMNEVKAGVSGTVAEVLADNAQPVEFGTRLLRIQPS
jgi:acetyl-CoA carboxylase biotin carboxyl carrier protein